MRRDDVHNDMGNPEMLGEKTENRMLEQCRLLRELEEGGRSERCEGPEWQQ